MQFSILLDILTELLSKRHLTASYLAQKHDISLRTVYRYVAVLSETLPLTVKRGRSGGIYLSDSYTLPAHFLTEGEYESLLEALAFTYTHQPEERFLEAKRKLSTAVKQNAYPSHFGTETIHLTDSFLTIPQSEREKLRIVERCLHEETLVEVEYKQGGKRLICRIEPHVLVLKENRPFVYAFCHLNRHFRLFPLGQLLSLKKTDEHFRKRPFSQTDIPLSDNAPMLSVRLELLGDPPAFLIEWLGRENIHTYKGKRIADVLLADNEQLLPCLLQFGGHIRILSPLSLQEKMRTFLAEISPIYS